MNGRRSVNPAMKILQATPPPRRQHQPTTASMITTSIGPGRTFHPFPRLPIELRFQIWGYHLPKARVLQFSPYEKERDFTLLCYSFYPTLVAKFEQQPLGVLPYVNRDSRAFFLSNYSLCFDGMLERPIYFCSKVDVVLFSNEYTLELFSDAVNLLPSAEARESVAPVRKAAIRWTTASRNNNNLHVHGGLNRDPDNLALDPIGGMRYRMKLRTLLERLPTLQHFAICYLFRSIGEDRKKRLVHFVERMEQQMRERMQFVRENANKSIAESAGSIPSIVMLQCPTGHALTRHVAGLGKQDSWGTFMNQNMLLGTRAWECSRHMEDFDVRKQYPL